MSSSFPSERGHALLRGACLSTVLLFASLSAAEFARAQDSSSDASSQDVAEAARQARARKAAQSQNSAHGNSHVYTNEDLQQAQIVARAAKGRGDSAGNSSVEARAEIPTNQIPAAVKPALAGPSVAEAAPDAPAGESLGEVARRYRQEKAQREAERASKLPAASPFHLPVAEPALAEMVPHASRVNPSPALAQENSKPAPTSQAARITANKRDPFSRPIISSPRTLAQTQFPRIANSLAVQARVKAPIIKHVDINAETAVKAYPAAPPLAARVLSTPAPRKAWSVADSVLPRASALPSGKPNIDSASHPVPAKLTSTLPGTVPIHSGDSLWKLSRRYLGSSALWPAWLHSNPRLRDPRKLRTGDVLLVPPRTMGAPAPGATNATQGAAQSRSQSVIVRPGDSLWKIAAQSYGRGSEWPSIAQANPQLQGSTTLHPAQRLMLPSGSPRETALHVSPIAP
jgi:nucleoid-associated protein YgaU